MKKFKNYFKCPALINLFDESDFSKLVEEALRQGRIDPVGQLEDGEAEKEAHVAPHLGHEGHEGVAEGLANDPRVLLMWVFIF